MKTEFSIDSKLQLEFANFSGDFNPLHIDKQYSRRSQFGSPVVHGIHLLLASMEQIDFASTSRIVHLEAEFRQAILVEDQFRIQIEESDVIHKISLTSNDKLCAIFRIKTEVIAAIEPLQSTPYETIKCLDFFEIDAALDCEGVDTGVVDTSQLEKLFPNLFNCVLHSDIDLLLMMTRTIGMNCPGTQALLRSFSWNYESKHDSQVKSYVVKKIDKRFKLIDIEFSSNSIVVVARVTLRVVATNQPNAEYIKKFVSSNEFNGVRAVVVGGSRGLGELAVRILACGGAEILFTYFKGESDAKQLVSILGRQADCTYFDARNPSEDGIEKIVAFLPTHLYYFATPPIQRQFTKQFNEVLYQDYRSVFVDGFKTLSSYLDFKAALFPSTSFITTNESGFTEYVRAKLEGEELCKKMNQKSISRVIYDRLPPLVTDQTSELLGTDTTSNVSILLPLIRKTFRHGMSND